MASRNIPKNRPAPGPVNTISNNCNGQTEGDLARAKAANLNAAEPIKVPYVDDERDYRDCVIGDALRAAIQLIEDDDCDNIKKGMALAVIRLARDRLQSSWPNIGVKFTAEVAIHG